MESERLERFSLQAALAQFFTALIAAAALTLAPVEFFSSIERSVGRPIGTDYGPMIAFGFMVSLLTALVAGLLAWAVWRVLLLPAGRLGFFPGAFAGAGIGVVVTFGFVLALGQTLAEWTDLVPANVPLPPAGLLGIWIVLSIPAALSAGLVGGLVGSAQLGEVLELRGVLDRGREQG